jgi:hypothetical protein
MMLVAMTWTTTRSKFRDRRLLMVVWRSMSSSRFQLADPGLR